MEIGKIGCVMRGVITATGVPAPQSGTFHGASVHGHRLQVSTINQGTLANTGTVRRTFHAQLRS